MLHGPEVGISWKGKDAEARAAVCATFDALPRRVHGRKEIETLFHKHRQAWRLLASTRASDFIDYLQSLHMTVIHLIGLDHNQERLRYGWRGPSIFDVAQSLQKNAYISHRSAAFLRGLVNEPGRQTYVNIEQSRSRDPRASCRRRVSTKRSRTSSGSPRSILCFRTGRSRSSTERARRGLASRKWRARQGALLR